MSWFESLAEERIREAQRNGDFDNNSLAGKPLPEENMGFVPEELRLAFKMLKNSGVLPEEMQLRKDIVTMEELLLACRDDSDKLRLDTDLSAKKLRYRMLMEERGWSSIGSFAEYENVIQRKMTED